MPPTSPAFATPPAPAAPAAASAPPDAPVSGALPEAVVFDLDGTLIDSVADVTATLNALLAEEGVAPPFTEGEVRLLMGDGVRALVRKALRDRGTGNPADAELDRLRDRFLDLYCADPVVATSVFPHALDLLAHLAAQGIAVGVCTNKSERPARLILERLGLDRHVGALVSADSGFGLKPAPGPLFACADRLGVARDRVVYVGDHPVDVEAARAAGMPVVAVAFGYSAVPAHDFGADRTVGCLSELPAALPGLVG